MNELPISRCLGDIVGPVSASKPVVLKAPPGAGKTTGVPPALFEAGLAEQGQILLVQPRRLAARTAAARLAQLIGSPLGDRVGYHVRFDRRASAKTELLVTTTGMLLRRLQSDPLLEDVACVLLDEFHERSLDVDLALGMLQRIRTTLRPELKLVVMSATLDPEPITHYLGDDAVPVVSEGRSFPVDVRYAPATSPQTRIEETVATVLPETLAETAGHVLVFLPGVGEIRRTHEAIRRDGGATDADILELYGDLPPKDQDAVLRPSSRRKIILATNVAETSITIPGVTAVIDSGLARVMRFDSSIGLPKLQREPISQASAEQRAGRAGRTEPGICYRLWQSASHRSRRERDTPEIERADFSGAALTLAAWGERDPFDFPWLTPPSPRTVATATELLVRLGAIDGDGVLTDIGRQMVKLPIHPRLARFMLAAAERNQTEDAAIAAALLTERDPFDWQSTTRPLASQCDVEEKVARLKDYFAGDRRGVHAGPAQQIRRVADQLRRSVDSTIPDPRRRDKKAGGNNTRDDKTGDNNTGNDIDADEWLSRALLTAYPDRVAKRRNLGGERGLMVGGRGVRLDRRSQVRTSELFLCIDVDSRQTEALVRSASPIEIDWLDPRLVHVTDEFAFQSESGGVIARRKRYFEDLLLSEHPIRCEPSPEVATALAEAARENLPDVFPTKDNNVSEWIERTRFLAQHRPDDSPIAVDDDVLDRVLLALCQTRTTLQQLRQAPWLEHLKGMYDYEQLQQIETNAPARIRVPSGNTIHVRYQQNKPPIMEVRIQELFGWRETPCVAGGRVPIQLHLLGPNRRPQQITEDLANFWKTTYQEVRKELRRRYPRHHWPEDPMTATATRNGLKPKS